MASWKGKLNGDPVPWLLEPDESQPAIRYYALRDILGRDEIDSEVKAAKAAIMTSGPVPVILADQQPQGYWNTPAILGAKWRLTERALDNMAQFGADGADPRVRAGCEYLLSQYVTPSGFNCGAARTWAALIDLGWLHDQRLQTAMEWLAQTITSSTPFACSGANANLPCAWGAIKAMVALSKVPPAQRTRNMKEAIKLGVDFLLSRDPAVADYPSGWGNKPSSMWFTFFYPLDSYADVLQNLEALAALGQARNPKLANALALVTKKQNQQGRWLLERIIYKEFTYVGNPVPRDLQAYRRWISRNMKNWVDTGKKGEPSKWVTLRALRVLKAAYPET